MVLIKAEDVMKIAAFLTKEKYDGCGMTVNIPVANQETLNKLNEDFFYRSKEKDDKSEMSDNQTDEILINVNGIKFRYFMDETIVSDGDGQENENKQ